VTLTTLSLRAGRRSGAGRGGEGAVTVAAPAGRAVSCRRDAARLRDLTAVMCAFGVAMVLAVSPVVSITEYGSVWSLFERQVMWLAIGAMAAFVTARIRLATWQRRAVLLLVLSMTMLLAVLVHGVGTSAGGSSRWIGAGPVELQPSELAKLAFVVFAADLMARRATASDQLRAVLRPLAIVLGAAVLLILRQPDLGTALLLVCAALAMCWAGGIDRRLLAAAFAAAGLVAVVGAIAAPYRRARLLAFLDPFGHASTSGYQLVQSLLALGSGRVLGAGVGGSPATWGLLPNAQTDFIFPVVGNELGIAGTLAILAGFALFAWLGLRIAARAADRFSMLLAVGITASIVGQALINIGGVVAVLPETGVPLPFVSFGGSSLVVTLIGCGLLCRIAREAAVAAERAERQPPRPGAPAPARARPRR
jgi:cell division protein FtsW